jgi:hypothetical protein
MTLKSPCTSKSGIVLRAHILLFCVVYIYPEFLYSYESVFASKA